MDGKIMSAEPTSDMVAAARRNCIVCDFCDNDIFLSKSEVTEIYSAMVDAAPKRAACHWRHDSDDLEGDSWYTDCGDRYVFIEGGPKENNCNFCHKCGKPVAPISGPEKPAKRQE